MTNNADRDSTDRLWTIVDCAAHLALSPKTIEKLRAANNFPRAIVIGRLVRWQPDHVKEWATSKLEAREDAA